MKEFSSLTWISIFAMGAMLINSFGIWAIYKKSDWAEKTKVSCMCFAAGTLISSPLIMAFPQALQKNSYAGFAALAGFTFMYFNIRFSVTFIA